MYISIFKKSTFLTNNIRQILSVYNIYLISIIIDAAYLGDYSYDYNFCLLLCFVYLKIFYY